MEFPIPDILLRDAYLKVAREANCARESFTSKTELIELVKLEVGYAYSHVPVDLIRDRITTCCKNPEKHGGGWSVTVNGHGKSKKKPSPEWYDSYCKSDHWKQKVQEFLEFWDYCCAVCNCRAEKNKPLDVHHRRYENLHNEKINDCIVLCRKCHKRHHKYMSEPVQQQKQTTTSWTLFQ